MYHVILTDEQRCDLNRRARRQGASAEIRDRLEMVRLSDIGLSVPKIARELGRHEQTVRLWIKAFLSGGFDNLASQPRGGLIAGKASALTPEMMAALQKEIEQGKRTWTASQIADWFDEKFGVRQSAGRICFRMKQAGLVYKRTNRTLKHKQKAEEVSARRTTLALLKGGAKAG